MTKVNTNPSPPERIRRVLVVLDPYGPFEDLLAVGTDLARRLRMEGVGLLLRDEALLGTADHPLAEEIQAVPAGRTARTRESAERQFRARVSQIERRLLGTARGRREEWTVAVGSGMTKEPVMRVARAGDLLVVAQDDRGETAYAGLIQTLLSRGRHPVLAVPPAARLVRSVQVVYSEGDAGRRALALAAHLATENTTAPVGIIVPGLEERDSADLSAAIEASLGGRGVSVVVLRQSRLNLAEAARQLDAKGGVVILPRPSIEGEEAIHLPALRLLGWPFLIIR